MTSRDVLDHLLDWYRDEFGDEVFEDGARVLQPEDSLSDVWFDLDWQNDWRKVSEGLNEFFGMDRSLEDWAHVLREPKTRTVGALCDFIAGTARRPDVQPVTIFGCHSLEAGVFLAIRVLLAREGVDVSGIRPSTPLARVLRRQAGTLVTVAAKICPLALTPLEWKSPDPGINVFRDVLRSIFGMLLVLLWAGSCLLMFFKNTSWLGFQVMMGVYLVWGVWWIAERTIGRPRWRIGELDTFADLACALSASIRSRRQRGYASVGML